MQTKLYLGKSCDAYSEGRGNGAWCWTNAGILTEFGEVTVPLTGIELPICAQHSIDSPCGCWEKPLPSMQEPASGQSYNNSSTTTSPQITGKTDGSKEDSQQRRKTIEKYLRILGFDPGTVDGSTDFETIAAYNAFQRANGLETLNWFPQTHFEVLERQTEETLLSMAAPPPDYVSTNAGPDLNAINGEIATTKPPDTDLDNISSDMESSQNSSIVRTEKNGFVHYRIDNCEYEKGLAATVYYPHGPWKVELTDVCFDREGGSFLAAEPVSNLTLVRKSETSDGFEVLEPNTASYQRDGILAGKYRAQLNEQDDAFDSGEFHRHSNASHPATRHNVHGHSTYGYLFKEMTPFIDVQMGRYALNVSVSDVWSALNRSSGLERGGEAPVIIDGGFANISGRSNELSFKTQHAAYVSGDFNLSLNIDDDGRIVGSGLISVTNSRIAGVIAEDWKRSELKISNFIGHFVGSRGREFRGIGFIDGQTVDQDGYVHESYGYVKIWGRYHPEAISSERHQIQSNQASAKETDTTLQIEEQLKLLGFDPGPVDGVVSEETIAAFNAFQKQFGLPQDDMLTPAQIAVLQAMIKARGD